MLGDSSARPAEARAIRWPVARKAELGQDMAGCRVVGEMPRAPSRSMGSAWRAIAMTARPASVA